MSAAAIDPQRFLRADALPIAQKFIAFLENRCHRVVIAGSLRRRKETVKDIEILFVPKTITVPDPNDMFGGRISAPATDAAIAALLETRIIAKRPNVKGNFTWGPENKLAVHIDTGIAVDFFATDEDRFWNALFVRTGPADLNKEVASRALARGWNWHAYGDGFTRGTREHKKVRSERDVFNHVELPYQEPWDR
jgi:DNA polymerase (family 10)